MAKVNYELRNMFPQVNKITFGRITTFCPLFCADDVLKDLESSYVTVSRVSQILEEIRRVDYTAFYRESLDMEHIDVMGKETIHLEYLPDIILMPNVGIRGVMWQEIEYRGQGKGKIQPAACQEQFQGNVRKGLYDLGALRRCRIPETEQSSPSDHVHLLPVPGGYLQYTGSEPVVCRSSGSP